METISSVNKRESKSYIAFFDLDRTMINSVSGMALAKSAWKNGLMNYSDLAKALLLSISWSLGLMDPVKVMHEMVSWVNGLDEAVFKDICGKVFNDILLPSLYNDVQPEIEMHRKNNGKTVILSSSVIQICRQFADHLGMDGVVCSELEAVNGTMTGRAKGRLCFGPEKLVRLKDYCEKNNNTLSEAWYYADAGSDIPVLETIGNPVCVNPDKKLNKQAIANNWKVCNWK